MLLHAKAFAPATVANVGPGFDVFGFALEGAGDVVEARRAERRGVRMAAVIGDGGKLPRDAKRNVVTAVAEKMTRGLGLPFGIDLSLEKGLPLGSGLGSSSASSVAAAVAVNELLGRMYGDEELLGFARFGERVACGAAHADNVVPSLFGGFCVVLPGEPPEIIRLDVPRGWHAAVVHPHFELPTRKARAAVPKKIPLGAMTANVAHAAAAIAAIQKKDLRLFGRAVMGDAVVVPARRKLIPHFDDVGRAAIHSGAAGVTISGAGPSMVALTESKARATVVAARMAAVWRKSGLGADVFVSRIGAPGARVFGTRRS